MYKTLSELVTGAISLFGGVMLVIILVSIGWVVAWRTILREIPFVRDLLNLPLDSDNHGTVRMKGKDHSSLTPKVVSFSTSATQPGKCQILADRKSYVEALDEIDNRLFPQDGT